jgi:predicted dehydrogenase
VTPLRAGVVGVGHLGRHHARLYAALPGVSLVGVFDTNPDQAAAIASAHGARVFSSLAELASQVDVASIATPTTSHLDAAKPLIEAGVQLLVEKPICDTPAAARQLIELAAQRGIGLMVGHTERFHPVISELRQQLKRAEFVECHRLAPFVPRSLDVDVVLDLMIHDLDLARLLLAGDRPVLIDASGVAVLTQRVDLASARIRFARGAANLTASRISAERRRRVRVFERDCYWACDTGAGTLDQFRVQTRASGERAIERASIAIPPGEPLGRELEAFVSAVRQRGPIPCTGEDGLAALEMAAEIVHQIEQRLDA